MSMPPTGTKSLGNQAARSGPSSAPTTATTPSAPPKSLFRAPPPGTYSVLAPKVKPPTPPEPVPVEITDDIGIRICPLYKDKTADETVGNVFSLLNSVGVRNFDVKAIRINLKEGYAKIELQDKGIEDYLVRTLSQTYKLKNQFNFATITDDFDKFKVTRLNNYVDPIIEPAPQKAAFVTRQSSMPTLPPCQCRENVFYKEKERIGFESKTMEFKCARWNMRHQENIDLVGKYVCAFLNGGGGIMYLGVTDDGTVYGIDCKEEQFLLFQKAITTVTDYIVPAITKDSFFINKIRVQTAKSSIIPKCVMEVCIKPVKPVLEHDTPYKYKGKAYWRREASTHQYTPW